MRFCCDATPRTTREQTGFHRRESSLKPRAAQSLTEVSHSQQVTGAPGPDLWTGTRPCAVLNSVLAAGPPWQRGLAARETARDMSSLSSSQGRTGSPGVKFLEERQSWGEV